MDMDIDFDVEELLFELKGSGSKSTIPLALLSKRMDMSKHKVMKLIYKARKQIFKYGLLIVQANSGGFYLKRFSLEGKSENE